MKRQPPFQWPPATNPVPGTHNDDPNAPYVNGNPVAGIEGSIPPAEVFDHPQKEIVNVITHAGLTPSHADLTQLRQAVSKMIDTEVDNENIGGGVGAFIDNQDGKYRFRKLKPGTNVNLTVDTDGSILIDATPGAGGGGAPDVTSGLGVDVNGDNELDLAYQTLPSNATPLAADIFARRKDSDGLHYVMTWAQMLGSVSGRLIGMQFLTASGDYTPSAGTKRVLAFAQAPGGAGGGAPGATAAGGGAGGTDIGYFTLADSSPIACIIGTGGIAVNGAQGGDGGLTQFGTLLEATGGKGGQAPGGDGSARGGEGGIGTKGLLRLKGQAGMGSSLGGGVGGSSFFGGGGRGGDSPGAVAATPGEAGGNYGGGGGGGDHSGRGVVPGGNGGNGCIWVVEFS